MAPRQEARGRRLDGRHRHLRAAGRRATSRGEEPVSVSARRRSPIRAKFKDIDETLAFSMTFPSGVLAVVRQHLRRARQPRRRRGRRRPASASSRPSTTTASRASAATASRSPSPTSISSPPRWTTSRPACATASRPASPARKACATCASSTPSTAPPPPAAKSSSDRSLAGARPGARPRRRFLANKPALAREAQGASATLEGDVDGRLRYHGRDSEGYLGRYSRRSHRAPR